eukprot:49332-Amphidinium_carterae.1
MPLTASRSPQIRRRQSCHFLSVHFSDSMVVRRGFLSLSIVKAGTVFLRHILPFDEYLSLAFRHVRGQLFLGGVHQQLGMCA